MYISISLSTLDESPPIGDWGGPWYEVGGAAFWCVYTPNAASRCIRAWPAATPPFFVATSQGGTPAIVFFLFAGSRKYLLRILQQK